MAIGLFVDIRVGRSPVRAAGLAENRRLECRGGVLRRSMGLEVKWKPNYLQFDLQVKTTTRRSSGKAARQAAAFRGRAQRKSNLPAHIEKYMRNRGDADKSRFRA